MCSVEGSKKGVEKVSCNGFRERGGGLIRGSWKVLRGQKHALLNIQFVVFCCSKMAMRILLCMA